jgi:hypothetical protein
MTLAMAVVAVVLSHILGVVAIGFFKYANKFIKLGDLWHAVLSLSPIKIFIAVIEFLVGIIEVFSEVAKMVSLSLRLFGNVFAGEVLLTVLASLLAFGLPVPFMLLELLVRDREVRVRFLGAWKKYFPAGCQKVMNEVEEATKKHSNHNLTFLLAYSGVEEMTQAVQKIAAKKAKQPDLEINTDTIKQFLYTKDLPVVDLVIRSGSEDDPHFSSGFMMLDVADAQLYFTKTHWPDFGEKELSKALERFAKSERRLGK